MDRWSRDQPQPGSFVQRLREAEKRDAGNEVGRPCWRSEIFFWWLNSIFMQIPPYVSLCKHGFWSHDRTHSIVRLIFPIVPLFPREKTNLNKKAFWQSILGSILWTFYTCNLKVQLLFSARETMATLVKYKCQNFITLTPGLGSKITPSWKWHIVRGEITLPLSQ